MASKGTAAACIALLLLLALVPTVQALEMHEMRPQGQVAVATKAHVDGQDVGLILVIDRGVNEAPRSALIVIPSTNQSTWRLIDLPDAPGAMAVGDVTGDGRDEVAITHHFAGEACPFPVVGQMPCGAIRIYDARALLEGRSQVLGEVAITPQPGPCQPSNSAPASLSLSDVTGDGKPELAMGQLGLLSGSCGVVHVLPGDILLDQPSLGDACVRIHGPATGEDDRADQFGAVTRLYTSDGHPRLAVSAPYADTPGASYAGHVSLYDVTDACSGGGASVPPLVAERSGSMDGHLLGASMARVEDQLWVTGKGGVLSLDPASFDEVDSFALARSFPLSDAGDMTGDGRSEVLAGHQVITLDGELVMDLSHFADQNFRGVVLSSDHILASDNFGSRIWSLTDLRTPYIELRADLGRVSVGDLVSVSIERVVTVVDVPGEVRWAVGSGTVVDSGPDWIQVRADAPGHMVARLSAGDAGATLRIPVDAAEATAELNGPATVPARHPFTLRVAAPQDAVVSWDAPDASPADHTGPTLRTQYDSPGRYEVRAEVSFADGNTTTLVHEVEAVASTLDVLAPGTIEQGTDLQLAVDDPDPDLTYTWHLEGDRMGPLGARGASVAVPSAGWGPVEAIVTARSSDGSTAAVGHAVVEVGNLAPQIQSLRVHTGFDVRGLEATVATDDPGGDPVEVTWYVDGQEVGAGPSLDLPEATPGRIQLTVVVRDEAGAEDTASRLVQVPELWKTEVLDDHVEQDTEDDGLKDKRQIPLPGLVWVLGVLGLVSRLKRP